MKRWMRVLLFLTLTLIITGTGYGYSEYVHSKIPTELNMGANNVNAKPITTFVAPDSDEPVKQFELTTVKSILDLGNGKKMEAYTFNRTAPGPELRVQEGDRVVVRLTNKLSEGVTIHWHGVNVPGAMDGIAGVTQDAVKPNDSYTYTFVATDPGTYWYHSHQESSKQVGLGLYGALIVEPKNETTHSDRDYSVTIHEWNTFSSHENMNGMHMSMGSTNENQNENQTPVMNDQNPDAPIMVPTSKQQSALSDMMSMYDTFTVNQASEGLHLDANPDEVVRLRIINAGNMTHLLTLMDTPFAIVALDGHEINAPTQLTHVLLPVGGAQRYDIVFKMPKSGAVRLVDADPNATERKMIKAIIGKQNDEEVVDNPINYPWFDFSRYGMKTDDSKEKLNLNTNFTKEFKMDLSAGMGFLDGQFQMVYKINGKVFPNIPMLEVKEGDRVKVTFKNNSRFIHPMHLHGHTFKVLTRNGEPLKGSSIYLDTLNVLPGETYDIAFEANNPGLWMFHCHDLHHAAAGMDTMLNYKGISTPFTIGKKSGNQPE